MFESLNQGISTTKGILIVVLVAAIAGAGILAYQYYWLPEPELIPPVQPPTDETADWLTYEFNVQELKNIQGLTEDKREEIETKIIERKLGNCSFEMKYPSDWTAYTWPLHGEIVPEGLIIEEDNDGCSFSMSFYGDPEKEKYCFPINYSNGQSNPNECNNIFSLMLSTFKFVEPFSPSITITSPNGGETWMKGQSYEVKWISPGIKNVNILLVDYSAPETCYLNGITKEDLICEGAEPPYSCKPRSIDAIKGSFSITNLSQVRCQPGMHQWPIVDISSGNQYKIKIEDADNPSISDFSDNYFIINEK